MSVINDSSMLTQTIPIDALKEALLPLFDQSLNASPNTGNGYGIALTVLLFLVVVGISFHFYAWHITRKDHQKKIEREIEEERERKEEQQQNNDQKRQFAKDIKALFSELNGKLESAINGIRDELHRMDIRMTKIESRHPNSKDQG